MPSLHGQNVYHPITLEKQRPQHPSSLQRSQEVQQTRPKWIHTNSRQPSSWRIKKTNHHQLIRTLPHPLRWHFSSSNWRLSRFWNGRFFWYGRIWRIWRWWKWTQRRLWKKRYWIFEILQILLRKNQNWASKLDPISNNNDRFIVVEEEKEHWQGAFKSELDNKSKIEQATGSKGRVQNEAQGSFTRGGWRVVVKVT